MDELNQRYLTALELMGEKAEMVEELQADLKDMKELYRNQASNTTLAPLLIALLGQRSPSQDRSP